MFNHPTEKLLNVIQYQGVEFEIVERPDVIWVGCIDYAANSREEPDIAAALKRYRETLIDIPKNELINPDWSASLSIHYSCNDKPRGIMFAQETYSEKQDERYDLFRQPGGLWLRVASTPQAAAVLLGRETAEPYEYFAGEQAPLQRAADANGYTQNPDVPVQVEYHCHADAHNEPHRNYAYIPVRNV